MSVAVQSKLHNKLCIKHIENTLSESIQILFKYKWLTDVHILDYYIDDHWSQLPKSWTTALTDINPVHLTDILLPHSQYDNPSKIVWPLSILSLRVCLNKLTIPRNYHASNGASSTSMFSRYWKSEEHFRNVFMKRIKQKKRHEIIEMANHCYRTSVQCGVTYVIDFGAGLGHLSRILAYNYGLKVCCIEQQSELSDEAKKIDLKFEEIASKYVPNEILRNFNKPTHLTFTVRKGMDFEQFVNEIKLSFGVKPNEKFTFGIVGLHPCGDLTPIIIDLYVKCFEARFINIVSCCHMKLSCNTIEFNGYPKSLYLNQRSELSALSYEAREVACHALETYTDRLQNGDYEFLKIHSYRSALEKIISKKWPHMRHSGMKDVKYESNFPFLEYCQRAVRGLNNIRVTNDDVDAIDIEIDLKNWKEIVIFYTLRLMIAPLIESVILNDRLLYLLENGSYAEINAIFDPKISPRNHIITAFKFDL